jgi:cytochrome c553
MNRTFSPLLKFLCITMLAVGSAAFAVEERKTGSAVKTDPVKGEALYTNGDAARNITACVSCHGAAGNSTISINPHLAGQHTAYVIKQLHDFRSASHNNPVMSPLAKALSDEDVTNIAAYLNAQTPKPGAARNKDTLELGRHIWRGGIASKNVPACAGCHGPNGAGIPAQYPRLAGQHQDYTVAGLSSFRSGVRTNSPQMTMIAERLSDREIKALADYIAGLK